MPKKPRCLKDKMCPCATLYVVNPYRVGLNRTCAGSTRAQLASRGQIGEAKLGESAASRAIKLFPPLQLMGGCVCVCVCLYLSSARSMRMHALSMTSFVSSKLFS